MTFINPWQATDQLVLGIDPGSRKVGWAVLRSRAGRLERLDSGTLVLDAKRDLPTRLGQLLLAVQRLLDEHPVDVLAIEAAFVHDNPHTALVLGQARGVPIALAAARGLPVFEYPPAQVKRTVVGSGRAAKEQMQHLIQVLLTLDELPQEDEADALAVALTHLRRAAVAIQLPTPVALALVADAPMTPARAAYLHAIQTAGGRGRKSAGSKR